MAQALPSSASLIDGFGRAITYLRISVTDRCDLRCRYCMAEDMQFLAPGKLMAIDEIAEIADAFIARGVRRIRLTGGEPLVRRGTAELAQRIGQRLNDGLDELTLTTNGTRLRSEAQALMAAGIKRINVSLDSRDPARFRHITRTGDVAKVLDGIAAAKVAGLHVKINMVALKGFNEDEILPMLRWCAAEGHDLTLIETMPIGSVESERSESYLPLDAVRRDLENRFTLVPLSERTGGPARYFRVAELDTKIGFITPLTNNFCAGCNRVRLTAEGTLYLCLGRDDRIDLRAALREGGRPALDQALDRAMAAKPERHAFRIDAPEPAVARHMNATGG